MLLESLSFLFYQIDGVRSDLVGNLRLKIGILIKLKYYDKQPTVNAFQNVDKHYMLLSRLHVLKLLYVNFEIIGM